MFIQVYDAAALYVLENISPVSSEIINTNYTGRTDKLHKNKILLKGSNIYSR